MTDKQTPPDWVLIEAAKRSGYDWEVMSLRMEYGINPMFRALCDMIERYEQPPVDRKLLCAREAVLTAGDGWTRADVAIRAIELWIEGYGE
jgi:hypothetical protein